MRVIYQHELVSTNYAYVLKKIKEKKIEEIRKTINPFLCLYSYS